MKMTDFATVFQPIPLTLNYRLISTIRHLQRFYSQKITPARLACLCFHNACGVSNPCKSAFLLAILEGCKRVASKSSKLNRLPILPEHLVALVNRFATPSASLGDIRDVCFCLLTFAGFLRFDELSRLRSSEISFFLSRPY